MKKKILYIEANNDGTIGGSYFSLLYLIQGLNKDEYAPIVLFRQGNELIPKFEKVSEVYIRPFKTYASREITGVKSFLRTIYSIFFVTIFQQVKIVSYLLEFKPDLVHLNNSVAGCHEWILACKILNKKIMAHDRFSSPPVTIQTKFFSRFLSAIVCVSNANKNHLYNCGIKNANLVAIHNGLDASKFEEIIANADKKMIKESLGVPQDIKMLTMVGNIDHWKGQLIFLKAFHQLLNEHRNIIAIFVGKTAVQGIKYEEEIQTFIEQNDLSKSVKILGYRSDVPEIVFASDIFIHASVTPEPFGRVILEAMALKKPIVATNSGGTPEQIIDGVCGLLVPMSDVNAMVLAISRYLNDENMSRKFGERSYLRLREHFTIENMVQKIEQQYKRILS